MFAVVNDMVKVEPTAIVLWSLLLILGKFIKLFSVAIDETLAQNSKFVQRCNF